MGVYKKKRKKIKPFVALGREMLKSKEWRGLSTCAKIVYIYLKHKYVGYNNGEVQLHYSELKDFMSPATISKGFKELVKKEWVIVERHGGLYRFSTKYRLTGKYDEIITNYNL